MGSLTAFNNQMSNLLNELLLSFPEDKDIKWGQMSVDLLKKTNPRLICNGFKYYIYQYKEQIINEDETFFLNKQNYEQNIDGGEYIHMLISKLQTYWKLLSKNSQKTLWLYRY